MGSSHSLSEDARRKHTQCGTAHGLEWGLSAMQGHRPTMEDAHTAETSIERLPGCGFFAVFDGHAGSTVSTLAATDLLPFVVKHISGGAEVNALSQDPGDIGAAIYKGAMEFDAQLIARIHRLRSLQDLSGSTAIMSMVTPKHIILANIGDSRAVLARNGKAAVATEDHKPQSPNESARVVQAGGYIMMGRVCGNLAVSRALGDFMYKDVKLLPPERQKISNAADITVVDRGADDDFLIIACDGIWDVVTNTQAVTFVSRLRKHGDSAHVACEKLLDHCLRRGSTDNMSALIIYFARPEVAQSKKQGTSWRHKRSTYKRSSSDSLSFESDVIPKNTDTSRGRGSTSEPIDSPTSESTDNESAEASASTEDDEADIIPMKTDLSRGRGSFILSPEQSDKRRVALETALRETAGTDSVGDDSS